MDYIKMVAILSLPIACLELLLAVFFQSGVLLIACGATLIIGLVLIITLIVIYFAKEVFEERRKR